MKTDKQRDAEKQSSFCPLKLQDQFIGLRPRAVRIQLLDIFIINDRCSIIRVYGRDNQL